MFVTPKFCVSVVFSFSWGHFNSQEKLKTILMQNFGVTNKEHYGVLWYFLEWSIDHFPSSKNSHFQNEAKCKIFVVKMRFSCMRIQIVFISMGLHLTSLWNRGLRQLWNGPFRLHELIWKLEVHVIGKFHDGVIWLHLPEFISFFFSYLNFVIPEGCPKQKA